MPDWTPCVRNEFVIFYSVVYEEIWTFHLNCVVDGLRRLRQRRCGRSGRSGGIQTRRSRQREHTDVVRRRVGRCRRGRRISVCGDRKRRCGKHVGVLSRNPDRQDVAAFRRCGRRCEIYGQGEGARSCRLATGRFGICRNLRRDAGRGTFVADVRLHGRRPRGVRLRDGEGRAVDRRRDLFLRRGEEFAAAGQEQQRHYRNAQKGYRTGVADQGRTDDRDEMARSRNRLCGRSVRLRCGQGCFDVGAEPFGEVLDRRRSPHVDRCFGHECGR